MVNVNQFSTVGCLMDRCSCAYELLGEFGIDPNRHSDERIIDVCSRHGLDPLTMLEMLLEDQLADHVKEDVSDWSQAPLDALLDHVVRNHHFFLRRQMRKLLLLTAKAVHDRGPGYQALPHIVGIVDQMRKEFGEHLQLEEQVLFPKIRQLVEASRRPRLPAEHIERFVSDIRHDFDEAGRQMRRLREVTQGFSAPSDAPASYVSLMTGLSTLEAELERHQYLEHDILLPRAVELQQALSHA